MGTGQHSPIAARYAHALFDDAHAQNRLDKVYADVQHLRDLIGQNRDLQALFANPSLPAPKVEASLRALFESRVDALTFRFLRFLVYRNRLAWFPDMIPLFEAYYDEHKSQLRVDIVSAVPLTDNQKTNMIQKLKRRFNKEILATYSEQSDLIGGFRVQVGDTIHDYSIATMLDSFKQKLLNA